MLKRLIDFVAATTPQRSVKFTLQDMALCALWHQSQRRDGAEDQHDAVGRQLDAWIENPDVEDKNTAGRRHQFLLRTLIEILQAKRQNTLTPDETAFLHATAALLDQVRSRGDFARVEELLTRELPAPDAGGETRQLTPGLATLDRRVQYVTEADIQRAPQSQIRLLAGIEIPCRGPIYKASGHLRILGDIPDNCTVVVENDGLCCVDGYVMGRVLAKNQCEIRHNISGVAIVLTGHIRARGIINNALVVAKMGQIVCHTAQGPRLVFAGNTIEVAESTMMGRFITHDMTVGDEVRGSHIEITGSATATRFRHLGMSTIAVVLRRSLSCADFGEVTGPELNQLLSQAYKLRRRARNFSHIAEAARREIEHTAQSVLMFIFGGGEVQKRLEGFLRAQRRYRFMCQVVDNLKGMLVSATEGATAPEEAEELPQNATLGDDEDLENDDELRSARADAVKLTHSLRDRALDGHQTTLLLEEARKKLEAMLALRARLAEQVLQEERSMQHLEKYEQLLAGSGRDATKLDVLNRILPALQNQPIDSVMGKRLRASFVVRARRNIERATRHAVEFEAKAEENLTDFRAVSDRLGKDYQIRVLEKPEEDLATARVTGRFEGGSRIFMDHYIEDLSGAPPDQVINTPDHDDSVRTYTRSNERTHLYSSE